MSGIVHEKRVLPEFHPPANLDDMTPEVQKIWSEKYISYWMTGEIEADKDVTIPGRTPLSQYFNGTVTAFDWSQKVTPVTWNAFPNLIATAFPNDRTRWQVADTSRMVQDEYLEWSVQRNSKKEITSVTYTCEGPEYWQVFASYQEKDFLALVREINPAVASDMQDDDFFLKDPKTGAKVYNPANQWNLRSNTGSILHLVQPNNTLSAEIDIAAQATVLRKHPDGTPVTDESELINCSQYGNPGRHSDPHIGGAINGLARDGSLVSVADPVALYIHALDLGGLKLDLGGTIDPADPEDLVDIEEPEKIFVWQRGDITKFQGLRFTIQIPEGMKGKDGKQLTVTNIYDTRKSAHIRYGGQIADRATMAVSAVTIDGGNPAPMENCFGSESAKKAKEAKEAAKNSVNGAAHISSRTATESKPKKSFPFPKSVGRHYL